MTEPETQWTWIRGDREADPLNPPGPDAAYRRAALPAPDAMVINDELAELNLALNRENVQLRTALQSAPDALADPRVVGWLIWRMI
jgi:hypothetical protein